MTVMLIYPPGDLYQRGEDRCQGSIDKSSASAMRACNDLGYAAAVLLRRGYDAYMKDYQTEQLEMYRLLYDIILFKPKLVMISTTNATIDHDINVANAIAKTYGIKIALKGAIFFDAEPQVLELLDLSNIDFLIGGEVEFSIGDICDFTFRGTGNIADVPNIFYKNKEGLFEKTTFGVWETDLDSIPFPSRHLMNNNLYVRPDTGEAMATIQTSRGCSAACTYCLSPTISGKKIRHRSPANVMAEIKECYNKFNIRNFFFKSDTFTMDAAWVKELCELIIDSPLHKKINFTANSRTNPLKPETLSLMKNAGCFMLAIGYESGSEETLRRVKKGASVEQNLNAAKMARAAKLPVFGFYMIGFPWETEEHLNATKKHIFETNPDFLEIHIALPYYGTELYNNCMELGTLTDGILGSNYFDAGIKGTATLDIDYLKVFRDRVTKKFYLRFSYIMKKLFACIKSPSVFKNYVKYGLRLLKN
jgi:radical SAM superfamily enzyme YgiQ (UPF0313 family)